VPGERIRLITMGSAARPVRQWQWAAATLALLVVAIVALAGTLASTTPNTVVLARAHVDVRTAASATLPTTKRSRPVRLTIPAIGIVTSVGKLGLQPDHEVMVPTTIHAVGWYIDGPAPGQLGSAVILGHVDSYAGAGVFFNLKSLKAGDSIAVVSRDGVTTHFVVTEVVQYSKTAFPDRLVYGSHGTRSLQLVTCGGVFDHATGHYESNIVVFSHLVGVTPAKAGTAS
jgi:sortase (surface protein transpeptidase)